MVTGLGAACVILGAAIACWADALPRHRVVMERLAGFLLLGGFGLLGYALSNATGHADFRAGFSECRNLQSASDIAGCPKQVFVGR
jgi:hypothetical protein